MITKDYLDSILSYKAGELYWKVSRGSVIPGSKAGRINMHGYSQTQINGKRYQTHRLIFMMHHGYLPSFVDHIDGDKLNNRIDNLRPATKAQNNYNMKTKASNTSGVKGVVWNKTAQKWQAQLKIDGKNKYLGVFDEIEQAKLAVMSARDIAHGDFANHGRPE